jgi:excisionase family DNA binding protein
MTVAEAAKALEVTPGLVYKLCRGGRLGHRRIGHGRGVIRIAPEDLAEYLSRCRVEGADPPEGAAAARVGARRPSIPDVVGQILAEKAARRSARRARRR